VDLTGWQIDGGIQFNFASGRTLSPALTLWLPAVGCPASPLSAITIVGEFFKSLSHHNDEVVLKDANGDPVNKVITMTKVIGRVSPTGVARASNCAIRWRDNSKPEAWAASDETHKSVWSNYTYLAVAAADGGPTRWKRIVLGMLTEGNASGRY